MYETIPGLGIDDDSDISVLMINHALYVLAGVIPRPLDQFIPVIHHGFLLTGSMNLRVDPRDSTSLRLLTICVCVNQKVPARQVSNPTGYLPVSDS
jgi:hypothetical protein